MLAIIFIIIYFYYSSVRQLIQLASLCPYFLLSKIGTNDGGGGDDDNDTEHNFPNWVGEITF